MKKHFLQSAGLFSLLLFILFSSAQTTDTYTSATTWAVPATVTTISVKVYGGGGGTGGQDCGAGCSNSAAGPAGYVIADFTVTPGDIIGIYPGGKGANGGNSVTGTGGGNGGTDTYTPANFNGGKGGNAGSSGSSGGGGGGGAASVVTINSTIKIVAGGAGGGGGMANQANSGYAGSSSISANGTNRYGGNGTTPGGDGGGGGGGGGGQYGSVGGNVHAAGGENAGNGGYRGNNSISGASSTTTNGTIAWTNAGRIEITYTSTLPVTWVSFTASRQNDGIVLKWQTATEQNTRDYTIQRSDNGSSWTDIGTIPAAGNSNTLHPYSFTDRHPANGLNYYRLLQADLDGNIHYSKVLPLDFTGAPDLLTVYPNPVSDGTLRLALQQPAIVRVYNNVGVNVIQKEFPAGTQTLNVSKLSKGVYYIKAKEDVVLFVIQ